MDILSVVGMGPGGEEYLVPAARSRIIASDILIGAPRHIGTCRNICSAAERDGDPAAKSGKREFILLQGNYDTVLERLSSVTETKSVSVVVSGDPCLFSFLGMIRRRMPSVRIDVIPGISSFQLLAARVSFLWNDAKVISAHGKDPANIIDAMANNQKVVIFTDYKNSPGRIAEGLLGRGVRGCTVLVGVNMGYPEEKVMAMTLDECAREWKESSELCVMILERDGESYME